jgi:Alw26I/Eco31I/Esp3I family type II restriction m6 adenine DNA methyltransferase
VLRNTDPYLVTYLGSKVIEQTYYEFFDPKQPSKPIVNLSVAKQFGTFFTPPYIARTMVEGLARRSLNGGLVDPCVGSGVLLCSALLYANPGNYIRLVGVELDTQIAFWSDQILKRVAELTNFSGIAGVVQGDGLAFLLSSIAQEECNDVDVIINPPYGRLRVTKDRFSNAETALDLDESEKDDSYQNFRSQISDSVRNLRGRLKFLSEGSGILEYSKLFFRLCAELTERRARIAIISPDSWMTGFDGRSLRKHLIEKRLIDSIILVKEDPNHVHYVPGQ